MTNLTVLASKNTAMIHLSSMKRSFFFTGQMPTQLRANLGTDSVVMMVPRWVIILNPRTSVIDLRYKVSSFFEDTTMQCASFIRVRPLPAVLTFRRTKEYVAEIFSWRKKEICTLHANIAIYIKPVKMYGYYTDYILSVKMYGYYTDCSLLLLCLL